jgi:hypothetical protein
MTRISSLALVISVLCGASAVDTARADESTRNALFEMARAQAQATAQFGHAPIAISLYARPDCHSVYDSAAHDAAVNQQIATLAASMKAPIAPPTLSAADLARGAY